LNLSAREKRNGAQRELSPRPEVTTFFQKDYRKLRTSRSSFRVEKHKRFVVKLKVEPSNKTTEVSTGTKI
jgi:hypothetical protein